MKNAEKASLFRVARGIVLIFALYSTVFLGWVYFVRGWSTIQRIRSTAAAILLWLSWLMLSRILRAEAKPKLEMLVLASTGILFIGSGIFRWIRMGTFIGSWDNVYRAPIIGILLGLFLILLCVVAWRGQCR